jgi:hypothetical protein
MGGNYGYISKYYMSHDAYGILEIWLYCLIEISSKTIEFWFNTMELGRNVLICHPVGI